MRSGNEALARAAILHAVQETLNGKMCNLSRLNKRRLARLKAQLPLSHA
ncbi:hypothetical protein [Litorisediminicola beolgyonensis]|uniref:Transposase n=1 Tax=Litorisediminicola beolgyonensis TaxID=1173614 RepID=A0ABW3ZK32_9RHOB